MSEPIKVGDLVVIIKAPHACCADKLGMIYRVSEIHPLNPYCRHCRQDLAPGDRTAIGVGHPNQGAPLSWLKRIPPLEELEGERTQEDIHEPA